MKEETARTIIEVSQQKQLSILPDKDAAKDLSVITGRKAVIAKARKNIN